MIDHWAVSCGTVARKKGFFFLLNVLPGEDVWASEAIDSTCVVAWLVNFILSFFLF